MPIFPCAFEELLEIAPDHHANHSLVCDLAALNLAGILAIAKYNCAIGDLLNFVHTVRDIDDGDVVSLKVLNYLEQTSSFCKCQTRGRLVHDDDPSPST